MDTSSGSELRTTTSASSSDRVDLFKALAQAVDALREHCSDWLPSAYAGETPSQFEFVVSDADPSWCALHLAPLAQVLLPARFEIRLEVALAGKSFCWRVVQPNGRICLHSERPPLESDDDDGVPPPDVVGVLESLERAARSTWTDTQVGTVFGPLAAIASHGLPIRLQLSIFLNKASLRHGFGSAVRPAEAPLVVTYLFEEALALTLERYSLADFEKEFCRSGQRTVILVFGLQGMQQGPLIVICGRGAEASLDQLTVSPLEATEASRIREILAFRESIETASGVTSWLTPDFFSGVVTADSGALAPALRRQLRAFQAQLSAIFLSDRVRVSDGRKYLVEYRGLGRVRLSLDRNDLLAEDEHLGQLYDLYRYAYEGSSVDKLETAQQFLSLVADSVQALCEKAGEVRDATKKTYDRALVEKVKDYFDARHKIQDRIRAAVRETADQVVKLSGEVSADVYKVAGIVLAAIAGGLLKPDFKLWAALIASAAVVVYVLLVLFYHLHTVEGAYALRKEQNATYIQSFADVLEKGDIAKLATDQQMADADQLFDNRLSWAKRIYWTVLALAAACALIVITLLIAGNMTSPIRGAPPAATAVSSTVPPPSPTTALPSAQATVVPALSSPLVPTDTVVPVP